MTDLDRFTWHLWGERKRHIPRRVVNTTMGDIAEMILDGILCEVCGGFIDEEVPGHPRTCED